MGKTVAAWLMVAGAIGAPATGPRETVETAVVRVVEVLQQSDGPDRAQDNRAHDNQRAEIKRIARALFDFDEIARRALSRHWGGRTLEEQGEFIGLFTDLLERSYLNRIEAYAGERIVYTGEAVDGPYATVRSKVVTQRKERGRDRLSLAPARQPLAGVRHADRWRELRVHLPLSVRSGHPGRVVRRARRAAAQAKPRHRRGRSQEALATVARYWARGPGRGAPSITWAP